MGENNQDSQSSQPSYQFLNLSNTELRDAFIKASKGSLEDGNQFFNRFKYVSDLLSGNYAASLSQGIDLLEKCRAIDEKAYMSIHKGSAYYWIRISAFLMHEHEIANFFFDAAVSEDIRNGADPINNSTPSFRFFLLEGDSPEQAAQQLVKSSERRFFELIEEYNSKTGSLSRNTPFSLMELRSHFLTRAFSPSGVNLRSSGQH